MKLYLAAGLGMVLVAALTVLEYREASRAALIRDKGTEIEARILVAEIEPADLLHYPEPATMDILYAFQPPGMEVQTGFGSIPLTGDEDEASLVNRYREGTPLAIRYLPEDVQMSLPVAGLDEGTTIRWGGLSLDLAAVVVLLTAAVVRDIRQRRKTGRATRSKTSAYRGTRLRDGSRGSPDAYDIRTASPEKIRFGKRC